MAKTYTVQAGDTLALIAEKFYSDRSENSWRKIFNANKENPQNPVTNPEYIEKGWVLTIPD